MTSLEDNHERMSQRPQIPELVAALKAAGSAHHEYQQTVLNGVFDQQWPMFYAAFVLGRIGDFTTPSALMSWFEETPTNGDWAEVAANHVMNSLSQ